jgi:hypothetical protein
VAGEGVVLENAELRPPVVVGERAPQLVLA